MCDNTELVIARGMVAGIRCEAEAWERHFRESQLKLGEAMRQLELQTRETDRLAAELEANAIAKGRPDGFDFEMPNTAKAIGYAGITREQRIDIERAIGLDVLLLYEKMLKVFEDLKVKMPERFMELGLLG